MNWAPSKMIENRVLPGDGERSHVMPSVERHTASPTAMNWSSDAATDHMRTTSSPPKTASSWGTRVQVVPSSEIQTAATGLTSSQSPEPNPSPVPSNPTATALPAFSAKPRTSANSLSVPSEPPSGSVIVALIQLEPSSDSQIPGFVPSRPPAIRPNPVWAIETRSPSSDVIGSSKRVQLREGTGSAGTTAAVEEVGGAVLSVGEVTVVTGAVVGTTSSTTGASSPPKEGHQQNGDADDEHEHDGGAQCDCQVSLPLHRTAAVSNSFVQVGERQRLPVAVEALGRFGQHLVDGHRATSCSALRSSASACLPRCKWVLAVNGEQFRISPMSDRLCPSR